MKKLLIGLGLSMCIVVVAYGILTINLFPQKSSLENHLTTYTSPELGIEFAYPAGPTGYIAEVGAGADNNSDFVQSLVLIRAEDKAHLDTQSAGGEGPPTITVYVFKNIKKQQPSTWAIEHPEWSNIELKTNAVYETTIGGASAIRYMADGLYASENIIVAHESHIYVISGMFIDANSPLRKDFAQITSSIRFIPTTKKPAFSWNFKDMATDTMTGAPLIRVTLVDNTTQKTYEAGTYNGSCFVTEASAWKPLDGARTGAICWFAGGGTELAVFEENGKIFLKSGIIEEGTAETAGVRGGLKTIVEVK